MIYGAVVQGLSVDLAGFVARLGGTPKMIELTDLRDRSFWLSAEAVTTVQVPPAGTAGAALAICGGHPYLARQSPDAIALLVD